MKTGLLFQQNVRASFHFVKEDIERMITEQQKILRRLELLEETQRRMLYSFASAPADFFIGDLEAKELHREDCLIVTSIQNFNKVVFNNKFEAKQQGFRECICLC